MLRIGALLVGRCRVGESVGWSSAAGADHKALRSDDIFILYFDNPPFAVFHDLAPDVLPTNGAVLVNMPDLNSFVTTESRIGESLILKVDSHSGSLTVSSADGKDILTYRALQSKNAANGHATAQSSAGLDEDGKAEIAAPRKWRVPSNGSDLWIAFPDQAPELVEVVSAGKRRNVFLVLLFALRAWWQRLCAVWLGEEPAESATQDPEGSNATERTSLLNGNVSETEAPFATLVIDVPLGALRHPLPGLSGNPPSGRGTNHDLDPWVGRTN